MAEYCVELENGIHGSYKKKFYKTLEEKMDGSVPYIKDFIEYVLENKGVHLGKESVWNLPFSKEIAIVTNRERIGHKVAFFVLGLVERMGEEDYDINYDYEVAEEESRIECINISELMKTMSRAERVKRLAEIGREELIIVSGYQEGKELQEAFELTKGVMANHVVMVIGEEVAKTKEFRKMRMEKRMDVIPLKEVGDYYFKEVFKQLLKREKMRLRKEEVDLIFEEVKTVFQREICEEVFLNLVMKAVEKKNLTKKRGIQDFQYFEIAKKEREKGMKTMNHMVGLFSLKQTIEEILAVEEAKKEKPQMGVSHRNMIFAGRPGTGKTTGAKLLGKILMEKGVCKSNFHMVTREDLIGEYLGQTAPKISKAFQESRDGILFIDEAGFLLSGERDNYLKEAMKEFVRFMEEYPDVMVIFAMYDHEVKDFLGLDKGLSSRIYKIITFEDYDETELFRIASDMFKEKGFYLHEQAKIRLKEVIERKRKEEDFGNARTMRKVVEEAISKRCIRIYRDKTKRKNKNVILENDIAFSLREGEEEKITKIGFQTKSLRAM